MESYLIQKGADCRIATDKTGFKKQAIDIKLILELNNLPTKRLEHLKNLYAQMMSISDHELPKTVEIPD